MKRGSIAAIVLAVLCLPLAAPAGAEQHEEGPPEPIIWVSFLKAKPGASQDVVQGIIKDSGPLWSQLLADGKIYEWGIAQPITHQGNDPYDVAEWATFADWAAVDAFVAAFMAKQRSMSEEERAANEAAYRAAVVAGSHFDAVHQSLHGSSNGERPGYILIGSQKANPGRGQELIKMWKSNAAPVFEQLLADGAIQGYGLFTQALHGDHSWTHASWSTLPGLASIGKINAAFEAAMDAEKMKAFMEAVDWESHRDELLAVVHYDNGRGE